MAHPSRWVLLICAVLLLRAPEAAAAASAGAASDPRVAAAVAAAERVARIYRRDSLVPEPPRAWSVEVARRKRDAMLGVWANYSASGGESDAQGAERAELARATVLQAFDIALGDYMKWAFPKDNLSPLCVRCWLLLQGARLPGGRWGGGPPPPPRHARLRLTPPSLSPPKLSDFLPKTRSTCGGQQWMGGMLARGRGGAHPRLRPIAPSLALASLTRSLAPSCHQLSIS
jgi:hypothetical protein